MSDINEIVSQLSLEDPNHRNNVIIAIDFGTSRTGVVWGNKEEVSSDKLIVQPLETNAVLHNEDKKIPTMVLLDYKTKKVKAFGQEAQKMYPEDELLKDYFFQYFKMSLHEQITYDPDVKAANRKPIKLSFLLRQCFKYIKDEILKIIRKSGIINHLSVNDIIWVLTVPAIWSDVAKSIMRKAAFEAGLILSEKSFRLILAYEPECAFIGAITQPGAKKSNFHINKKYLIIDCGGGTIDITCHKLLSIEPIRIQEIIRPIGGYLGSTLIDKLAFAFFEEFFGEDVFEDLKNSVSYVELYKVWEEAKLGFRFNKTTDKFSKINIAYVLFELNIRNFEKLIENWNEVHPDKLVRKYGSSILGMSYNLMMTFFEDPIQDVVNKVKEVIDDNRNSLNDLDHIILAGGFCKNIHLQDKLIKEFQEKRDINVIILKELDLLIVRGAAVYGSAPNKIVKTRKAKYTFGIHYTPIFDPDNEKHLKYEHKKYISRSGKYTLLEAFRIYGRINEDIEVDEGKKGALVPLEYYQRSLHVEVYTSTEYDPFHISEEGNKYLASATVPLDMTVPFDKRGVKIEFKFGGTEVTCCIYSRTNGEFLDHIILDYKHFFY